MKKMYFLSLVLLLSGVSNVFAPASEIISGVRKLIETNQEKEEEDQKILKFKTDYVEYFLLKTLQSALRESKAFDIGKAIDEFLSIEKLGLSGLENIIIRNKIKNQIVDNLRKNGLLKINEVLSSESFSKVAFDSLDEEVKSAVEELHTEILDQIKELKKKSFERRDLTKHGAYRGLSVNSFDDIDDKAFAEEVLNLAKKFGFKIETDEKGNVINIQDNENLNIMRQKFLKYIASQMYSESEEKVFNTLRENGPKIQGPIFVENPDQDLDKTADKIVGERPSEPVPELTVA